MSELASRLGEWGASVRLDEFPDEVVDAARCCLIDGIGVMLAGTRMPVTMKVRDWVERTAPAGECSIALGSRRVAPAAAALANGCAAHAMDFDDTYAGMVHGTAVVLPALLAAAQSERADGETLLGAFIVAAETTYALSDAMGGRIWFKGWFPSGVFGAIGAAAGAARIHGLDAAASARAIGIAASQVTGNRAGNGTEAKAFLAGRAAQAGVDAALTAQSGVGGLERLLDGADGFVDCVGDGQFDGDVLSRLGTVYALSNPGVAFKPYPACSGAQAGIEATLDIIHAEDVDRDAIESVRCEVSSFVLQSLPFANPATINEAQFSMHYPIACAIAFGRYDASHLDPAVLASEPVRRAIAKVTMVESPGPEADPEGAHELSESARVTITTGAGGEWRRFNPVSIGEPRKPMSEDRLARKFLDCVSTVMSGTAAEALLTRIRTVELLTDCSTLLDGGG